MGKKFKLPHSKDVIEAARLEIATRKAAVGIAEQFLQKLLNENGAAESEENMVTTGNRHAAKKKQ